MRAALLLCLFAAPALAETLWLGRFSQGDLAGWERHAFRGETRYFLVREDGRSFLRAEARASASGLIRRVTVDLERTPWLHWSWRPHRRLAGLDERRRGGDDYVARLYVVVDGGWAFWRTRALSLVWSSNQPRGAVWANPYSGNVVMVAVRGRADAPGRWMRERVDLRALVRRHLGPGVRRIDAVALMTDSDDSGAAVVADYGDLWFSSEGDERP